MAARQGGLGRGLGALIRDGVDVAPVSEQEEPAIPGIQRISVDAITPCAFQPRRAFDEDALGELAQSIRQRGVLQPLLVRQTGEGYELMAGERRLRASIQAGLEDVPVIIMEAADEEALEVALVENLQREDLNIVEIADGYQLLLDRFSLTHEQVADRVGCSRSAVTNALRIRELPEPVRALLAEGKLSAGHAKLITGLTIPEEQTQVAEAAVSQGLSVRALDELIKKMQRPPRKPRAMKQDLPASHIGHLSDRLHSHFGTSVRVTPSRTYANGKKGKGSIQIDFFSNEDLDRIIEVIGLEID
ncbi:MAG: ParB/RepB/Spo0J family partition protein [Kiritimatiellia bacterium]|jgi:ParB family chromosome partitioning protein|nr:ParB/RepB/Spo0J family partition protein [Kiritimatiellia bacterium]MDP6630932.1 ParB/RepB/Spo0J family partition protein [Kiritimatiellia bacterium]MDP6810319.1 ParB/RepB/Spo0J family partition protein [Kiritimatiellia bacterium]MDP7022692.1 ParB/RepB/Spo0J family partition protein [Kiritimatiellia bacterium]